MSFATTQKKNNSVKSNKDKSTFTRHSEKANNSQFHDIRHLQQTLGNQAIQRMIRLGVIQASLKVSHPNDPYEKEADRVAAKIMGMSENKTAAVNSKKHDNTISQQEEEEEELQTKQNNTISRKCPSCEMNNDEDDTKISRKPTSSSGATNSEVSNDFVQQVNNSGTGKSLDNSTKQFMESRIGHDFGNVRIHDGAKANKLTDSINARAFTIGNNIF